MSYNKDKHLRWGRPGVFHDTAHQPVGAVRFQCGAGVYALMNVQKGVAKIEMLCLNSRENFEENKSFLRKRDAYQEGKHLIPELTIASYERAFEIEYTHHSTAIEGNTLTLIVI